MKKNNGKVKQFLLYIFFIVVYCFNKKRYLLQQKCMIIIGD